jgi:hypothetical protein
VLEWGYYVFQNPPYMASRQLMITRIAASGTSFSPLPSQASHGYMVTITYLVEVKVGSNGHASAHPPGLPPLRRQRASCMDKYSLMRVWALRRRSIA